ncbi:hypothetical protein Tco_0825351 [Tanacetum coccineum]
MKRGFRGVPRPLLPTMLSIANPATTIPPLSQPAPPTPIAETTNASLSPTPSPAHEPMEHTFEHPSTDQQPPTPSQEATTCSQLIAQIDDLEKQLKKTKQTFGKAILTLVERSVDKGKRYKRRKSSKESAGTGLDFKEVNSAFEEVNTRVHQSCSGWYWKRLMLQFVMLIIGSRSKEAGLAEAIRLDALEKALEKEEVAKQVHLDSLLAQRMAEEKNIKEEQKIKEGSKIEGKCAWERICTVEDYCKKRRMVEEDKEDSQQRLRKRRKPDSKEGFHTHLDKYESDGVQMKLNAKMILLQNIKQGRKGVNQDCRENGTNMVYISFGAMLTDISRDDLTKLYRIVMRKHGMNEPEDEFEKGLWEYFERTC